MLDIVEELKNIYRNDRLPLTAGLSSKYIKLYFPDLDITISKDKFDGEAFELNESLCHGNDLIFGSCEASQIKITIADIDVDLSGHTMIVTQIVNDAYTMPLGTFTVKSCKRKDDQWFREIIAYDGMKKLDVDVTDWYNGLFPTGNETYTLAQFRALLLAHFGIEEDTTNLPLPNDNMIVQKTIEPTQLSGRTVMEACEEINGCFGHMGRNGKFRHIVLQPGYGLYPSETLYPSEDLFPIDENDMSYTHESIIDETISRPMYKEVRFEEYTVKEIDKLIIRAEEDDVGAIVGDGSNAYIIQGNFLVFGKTADELKGIASSALGNMAKRPYRPFKSEGIGLPFVEVGDALKFATSDPVTGYVLQRTLSGIQALIDKYTAQGKEEREQNFGLNTEIMQIKGRQTKTQKDVNGLRFEVEDLESRTNTKFTQTDEKISLESQRAIGAEGTLSGQINVLAGQVVLKADANGNIATVELDADPSTGSAIKLKADNMIFEGLITANGNFKILMDGSMEAVNGKFTGDIISSSITGTTFIQTGSKGTVRIADGGIVADVILTESIASGFVSSTGGMSCTNIQCNTINTYTPIHSGNIDSQSVAHAEIAEMCYSANEAITARSADYAARAGQLSGTLYTNQIYASNTGYGNIDFQGFDNAAGVNWVQSNYQPIGTSDVRLKYDIHSLEVLPDELFYSLKPKRFKYKTSSDDKVVFGLIAQQVENSFSSFGFNPLDYNLFDIRDVKAYTDDGQYVKEDTHRLNYMDLIPWMIKIIQGQNERISLLEEKLYNY